MLTLSGTRVVTGFDDFQRLVTSSPTSCAAAETRHKTLQWIAEQLKMGTWTPVADPFIMNELQETEATILFSARLLRPEANERIGWTLALPRTASAKLPSRGMTMVDGTINGFPFRAVLEPDGKGSHWLKVSKALHDAAGADAGGTATVEITRVEEEPETRVPMDLRKALAVAPPAQALWGEITPIARRDWILWISSAKQLETRKSRIEKACAMLASGKRRVCCFGGLNWLTKDHASVETWLPLPKSKSRFSPRSTK